MINRNLSRRTPHPALRATFPSRGRLLEHAATVALAFPLRGRWHDEVVTDEVVLPHKFQFISELNSYYYLYINMKPVQSSISAMPFFLHPMFDYDVV